MTVITMEQRMKHLGRANDVRLSRGALKRELLTLPHEQSCARAAAVVESLAREFEGMEIGDLIRACRQVGPSRVRRWLRCAQVSEWRKLSSLTESERDRLVRVLRVRS